MTYCCALRLDQGLVFISDTRTNAGLDHIAVFRKLFRYGTEGERLICLQCAGNLATTQAVIGLLEQHIALKQEPNLVSVQSMFEAASLVGKILRQIIENVTSDPKEQESYYCSILLGGQIKGEEMQLYNIYPQGNFIAATQDTPYFQIGESKYGKPILDRALTYDMPLDEALRCSLISFDSTLRSNVSVGMPIDVLIYSKDSFHIPQGKRITEEEPYFQLICKQWSETLRRGLQDLSKPTSDFFK